jgi:septal ring factor EnvC (AmiA/AmiB activator)
MDGLCRAGLLAAGLGLAVVSPGRAEPPADADLEKVEQALERERAREKSLDAEGARIEAEIDELRSELVAVAAAGQAREGAILALEQRLKTLAAEETTKLAKLELRKDGLIKTLAALQILSRQPAEALIASPAALTDLSRANLLLGAVVPQLERQAGILRTELDELLGLRTTIAAERRELAAEAVRLEGDRQRIAALIDRKWELYDATEAERRQAEARARELAAEARDLQDLVARLEADRAAADPRVLAHVSEAAQAREELEPETARSEADFSDPGGPDRGLWPAERSIAQARGALHSPVRGMLVGEFDQKNAVGVVNKGIMIEARPDAIVVAPFDGVVAFAGPFRGYGQLLIIAHGEGYHTLLAGFGRIDCVLDQRLLAGEPVGSMGSGGSGRPRLYVELRHDGQAINPLPWLAPSDRMVSG